MSNAGKELEDLIATIERAMGDAVRVEKNYFFKDKATGQRREVDVAVFSNVGTASILIIFECRDRKKVQDVQWIEQLASKRESVRAAKAVAVSSSGFTNPAIIKAKEENVELRLANNLTESEIKRLFGGLDVEITHRKSSIKSLVAYIVDPEGKYPKDGDLQRVLGKNVKDLDLVRHSPRQEWKASRLWAEASKTHSAWKAVPQDGTHVLLDANVSFNENDRFSIRCGTEEVQILGIKFHADCWYETISTPFLKGISYERLEKATKTSGESLASAFRADVVVEGKPMEITLVMGSDKKAKSMTFAMKAVNRNEPCPCKSGKKFKVCCGAG